MSIWNWIFGDDVTTLLVTVETPVIDINPATGLPMIDGFGGVDIAGSPYGMDLHHNSIDSPTLADWGCGSYCGGDHTF
jgi:hypothetical protein